MTTPAERVAALLLEGQRRIRRTRGDKVPMKRPRFLWNGRIPLGEICLFTGLADLGKSTITAWIAARVTRGELDGEFFGQPKDVYIVATEDSREYTIAPRMAAAGADMTRVHFIDVEYTDGTVMQFEVRDAEALIEDTQGEDIDVALVVFDPLVSVLGRRNRNAGEEVRPVLERIKGVMETLGAAALGLGHYNKDRSNYNMLSRISGSAEFGNVVRAALGLAADEDEDSGGSIVLGVSKLNIAPKDAPALRFRIETAMVHQADQGGDSEGIPSSRAVECGESSVSVQSLMEEAAYGDPETIERRVWLKDYLTTHGKVPAKQVTEAANERDISRSAVYRAKKVLGVVHDDVLGVAHWELP